MIDIPVVLFVFKRKDTIEKIINILSKVQPKKLYIMSDEGRDIEEKKLVKEVRETIESKVNWRCEVIKNYATTNRGVYKNIGLGSKWVFEREEMAIFLEDDNLPEVTFFDYCEKLLKKYKNEERVLWVCGTNYLGEYTNEDNDSYMFTQHLLPCGWASWSNKFLKYYDDNFDTLKEEKDIKIIKKNYTSNTLFKQQYYSIAGELYRKKTNNEYRSWDYHMAYTLRYHNLLGISPQYNQIRNIGADEYSEHGGTSLDMVMTNRFCEIETLPMNTILKHPKKIEIDPDYEKKIDKIITMPFKLRLKASLVRIIKRILKYNIHEPIR